jgi:hypothetical protein
MPGQAHFEIRVSKKPLRRQRFYVATVGRNGEDLQTSEMLSSEQACDTNIRAMSELTGMLPIIKEI